MIIYKRSDPQVIGEALESTIYVYEMAAKNPWWETPWDYRGSENTNADTHTHIRRA